MTADLKSSRSDNDLQRRAVYFRGSEGLVSITWHLLTI